jgi:methionyl-tRNA formyltransferase
MNKPAGRIVFAGSPEFAVPSLAALVGAGRWDVVSVLTQPDRPAGRGRRLRTSPIKAYAEEHGIAVLQPASLRREPAVVTEIAALAPDVIVVVAYGLMLPPQLLRIPRAGCLNVHASLLPRWRGAAPIAAAIMAGDTETGVALMKLEEGLDTGPVFATTTVPIRASDTAGTLQATLAELGAKLLLHNLPAILAGEIQPVPQPTAGASYAAKISKDDAQIDWSQGAVQLHRLIRAYQPWPVAETRLRGAQLRCWESMTLDGLDTPDGLRPAGRAGEIVEVSPEGFEVQTGCGILRLTRVQPAGGKPMSAGAYARGHALLGEVLGQ